MSTGRVHIRIHPHHPRPTRAKVRKVPPLLRPTLAEAWRYVVPTAHADVVVGFRRTQLEAVLEALRLLRGGTP